jgi:trans-aconitate methyltransferase
MSYYDDEKNVSEYIKMAEGFDGKEFLPILKKNLKENASMLELGMGPGKDVELFGEFFRVTGSDSSQVFLDRFQESHPDADLLLLDAATMDTDRHFDCIYSNKVLYHLSKKQLKESFHAQAQRLTSGGLLFHTFWYGDHEESQSGLQMVYYTHETITQLIGDEFEELAFQLYAEMEEDDSFYLMLRKKDQ